MIEKAMWQLNGNHYFDYVAAYACTPNFVCNQCELSFTAGIFASPQPWIRLPSWSHTNTRRSKCLIIITKLAMQTMRANVFVEGRWIWYGCADILSDAAAIAWTSPHPWVTFGGIPKMKAAVFWAKHNTGTREKWMEVRAKRRILLSI
jgi:hypothetical protein